jgi:intraflagellar transport protein 172
MYVCVNIVELLSSQVHSSLRQPHDAKHLLQGCAVVPLALGTRCIIANPSLGFLCYLSIALLRDCGPLAWDKAYLKAGQTCEALRWNNLAYMFYSRYLDIIEAIEEEDSSMLDNTDFMDTDLPSPYNMKIPKPDRVYSGKETEEEIREKTLSWAMDDTLDQESGIDDLMAKLKFSTSATAEVTKKSKRWIRDYTPGTQREWDDGASLKQMLRIMRLS